MNDHLEDTVPTFETSNEPVIVHNPETDELFKDDPHAQAIRNRLYALAAVVGPLFVAYGVTNLETVGLWVTALGVIVPMAFNIVSWFWSRRNKAVVLAKK